MRSTSKAPGKTRIAAVCILSLALSVFIGLQAASMALARKAPVVAADLFPPNGLAQEYTASALLALTAAEPDSAAEQSGALQAAAMGAYTDEPLSPTAHAVLALSLEDAGARQRFVDSAIGLNRRDQKLLAVALQQQVEREDYAQVIGTLDRILRVRPSRTSEFFPILLPVFAQEGAADEFAEVLDGQSRWHRDFLNAAVRHPPALPNLLELRPRITFADRDFDTELMRRLPNADLASEGFALYRTILEQDGRSPSGRSLGWASEYGPYDWTLADTADVRAQQALDGEQLEIYIRPGKGGVLARRIIPAPSGSARLSMKYDFTPAGQGDAVKLTARCFGSEAALATQDLTGAGLDLEIGSFSGDCDLLELLLSGRVWSGQPVLQGTIEPIAIR